MDEKKETRTAEKTPAVQEPVLDLKGLREARGLTLHDIFETTRVSPINLSAVENEDYHRLPPPVYARNFIRKYAQAIGTDVKPILDRYEKHLESLNPQMEETTVRKPWPEEDRRYRFLFISLAAVIAVGTLVFALFLYDQGGKAPSTQAVETSSPAQVLPAPGPNGAAATPSPGTAAAEPAAAPGTATMPAPAPGSVQTSVPAPASSAAGAERAAVTVPPAPTSGKMYPLIIEARDLTWIRITEDRNPSYQVLLKPGDKIERMASDYFQLDIGNAGGINLTFQGKSLGSLGKPGQIIHLRLPEKGAERKP